MQKNKPSNSGLNKALIFVSAFVVSSLVIYQVYYYNKVKSLSSGIVATAAELPGTQIDPFIPKHFSGSSYMGNAGLLAALGQATQSSFAEAPKENYLSGNGVYSKAFLDEINIGISNKFPNHPPIGFPAAEGDKVLFSYLFKNIVLPAEFTNTTNGIKIDGKHFRAIQYMAGKDSNVSISMNGEEINAINVKLNKNTETLIISKTQQGQFTKPTSTSNIKTAVTFPEIDFNIIKYWKAEEAGFVPHAKDYKHLEERLKLKLSTVHKEAVENKAAVEIKPPFYIYLYKSGEEKPYFMLYIADTELLLPVKGK